MQNRYHWYPFINSSRNKPRIVRVGLIRYEYTRRYSYKSCCSNAFSADLSFAEDWFSRRGGATCRRHTITARRCLERTKNTNRNKKKEQQHKFSYHPFHTESAVAKLTILSTHSYWLRHSNSKNWHTFRSTNRTSIVQVYTGMHTKLSTWCIDHY